MKSRVAILSALVMGFALSGTGAGLAITGFTANDQASVAEYPPTPQVTQPVTPPAGETPDVVIPVLPEDGQDVAGEETESGPGSSNPRSDNPGASGEDDVQTTRQVEAGTQATGDSLPFTGFAAIPVLLLGLALLSAGLVMRRSAQQG